MYLKLSINVKKKKKTSLNITMIRQTIGNKQIIGYNIVIEEFKI